MTTLLEHLHKAVKHLRAAEEKANLGTRMMIQGERESLEELVQRTENIQKNDDKTE